MGVLESEEGFNRNSDCGFSRLTAILMGSQPV